jgi:hypothetical protein
MTISLAALGMFRRSDLLNRMTICRRDMTTPERARSWSEPVLVLMPVRKRRSGNLDEPARPCR